MWHLSIFKTTWLDQLIQHCWNQVKILGWNTVKLLTGMQKTLHSLDSCTKNFPLIQISSILSVNFTSLWHKCQSALMGQLHLSKACWELWLSDDQPHSDYNGQWQRAVCILAVLQSSQTNPQRNKKNGSWQTSLGLGSISRYSAQILICILYIKLCSYYAYQLWEPWWGVSPFANMFKLQSQHG